MGNSPEGPARVEREQDLAHEPHSYDQQASSAKHSGTGGATTALRALNLARGGAMRRGWNTKEARIVYEWASIPEEERPAIEEISKQIARTPQAILKFLRRQGPPDLRLWSEKARWRVDEADGATDAKLALEWASLPEKERPSIEELSRQIGRSPKAIVCFLRRHLPPGERPWTERPRWHTSDQDGEGPKYTIPGIAEALGVSRRTVYRLINEGYLRRWKGGVSEASFVRLVTEHPELIPYARVARAQEWLVLNGVPESIVKAKATAKKKG